MINKFHRFFFFPLIIIIFSSLFPSPAAFAAPPKEKHILFLHAFTPDYPAHEQYIKGLKSILEKNPSYLFSYSYEYLDYARHPNETGFFENISAYLKLKYKEDQPDFIVTDFNLFPLLDKYGETIFPQVPVIMAWNGNSQSVKSSLSNPVFISQTTDADQNIRLILDTRPMTRKIYLVVGDSADERQLADRLLKLKENYKGRVELVYLNKLPYAQMLEAVRKAEEDSAVLYFHWLSDVEGESFLPAQVIQTIARETKAPVYGTAKQFLGIGIVGGYVKDFEVSGQAAANAINDMLNGIKPFGVTRSAPSIYAFDWRQLKRWGINEGKLPDGSQIEYREDSVWEQYGDYVVGGLAFMVLQTLLILTLIVNRSRRKRAERQLIEANKMKDEFLVNTSHELQTPLNGIINISESLAEGRYGSVNPKQQEELKVVLAVSRRLSSLIKDVIDMEKIKRNEFHLHLAPIDVKSASSVVLDVIKHLNPSKNVGVVVNISEDLSPVYADENRLIQILFNLLGNAIKFTVKGKITLSAWESEEGIILTIEDTGIGISREKQKTLFQAFVQGDEGISSQYGGSGLGLYISRQLLERMNGQLRLEWSEPGIGTCFSIRLPKSSEKPVHKDQTITLALEETAVSYEKTGDPLKAGFKLLAVDDEPTNLRVLKSLLDDDGYEVFTASNGLEAVEIIKKRRDIDLLLMDVMMPGMSGYEACRKIREDFSLINLPLLMLTVRNTPEDIAAGFEAGANDFVVKPFVAKELRARVATQLMMKKSAQEALNSEMAFLQAQIKPHFLYNTLNTISYFCVRDGEMAKELLNRFSGYLRSSFDFKNLEGYASLKKEMEFVETYLEIEKVRFGSRLQVFIEVEEEAMGLRIPPLVLQPLVENSVLHGVMKKIEGGTVEVTVKRNGNEMEFTVRDNGVGMTAEQRARLLLSEQDARSVGLQNIHMRLGKLYGRGIRISGEEGHGTVVAFSIPLEGESMK